MHNGLTIAALQAPGYLVGPQSRIDWLKAIVDGLESVDLIVLPELFLTGYNIGERVLQWAEKRDGAFSRKIAALANANQVAIHFGYAEQDGKQIYNSAACYNNTGAMIGHHRKLLLPPGFEANYFSAGTEYSQFEIASFKIATLICYDAEFPEAFRAVATQGANLVVVPTALGAQWGVVSTSMMPTRAFENGVYVCYVNHCGKEHGMNYFGGSCIVGPDGKDLARATGDDTNLRARLDVSFVHTAQKRLPYHADSEKLPSRHK